MQLLAQNLTQHSQLVIPVTLIINPEKYIKKIAEKSEIIASKKAWNLIKGNGSLSRNSGTKNVETKPSNKKDLVIDYKNILNS